MARPALWRSIAASLTKDIAEGLYPPGEKLPTEAQLSARFGVNRHTVRRALADLAEQGMVHSRRGAGVFVAQRPADYPIGARVRYTQNLRAAGRVPGKEILTLETRLAKQSEAEALHLPPVAEVHICEGIATADGQPMAVFRSAFPAARFPDLPALLREISSITEALSRCGVRDYTRASTRIRAEAASAPRALHLRLKPGDPLLRAQAINVDQDGAPVEFGVTWFAGERVTLSVEK